MDQIPFEQEQSIHRKAWEALRDQVRRDYSGQYVGLAQGRFRRGGANLSSSPCSHKGTPATSRFT
jgi:hypothetical protein